MITHAWHARMEWGRRGTSQRIDSVETVRRRSTPRGDAWAWTLATASASVRIAGSICSYNRCPVGVSETPRPLRRNKGMPRRLSRRCTHG